MSSVNLCCDYIIIKENIFLKSDVVCFEFHLKWSYKRMIWMDTNWDDDNYNVTLLCHVIFGNVANVFKIHAASIVSVTGSMYL
jgi:hypothetical protein